RCRQNSGVSSGPPSSHLLQHCCKLVWIDTVSLHNCLDDRIGQYVLERGFVLTPIHNHSLPRWSQTTTACYGRRAAADRLRNVTTGSGMLSREGRSHYHYDDLHDANPLRPGPSTE